MPKGLPEGIDKIGSNDLGQGVTLGVKDALELWVGEFIIELERNLQKSDSVSSGALIGSIRKEITPVNGGFRLSVFMEDYYDFVDKGVKGVKSSVKAPTSPYSFKNLYVPYEMAKSLQAWMQKKNFNAFSKTTHNKQFYKQRVKTFRDVSLDAAYSLGVSLKKKGIKPNGFYSNAHAKLMPTLEPMILSALKGELVSAIKYVVKRGEITKV
jgi:hypothetical protein